MIKYLMCVLILCLFASVSLAEPPEEGGYFGYITVYDGVLRCDGEVIEKGDSVYEVMAYCGRADRTITARVLWYELHTRTYYRVDDGEISTLVVDISSINERVRKIETSKIYGLFDRLIKR